MDFWMILEQKGRSWSENGKNPRDRIKWGFSGFLAPKMGKMMDKTWKNRKIANKKEEKRTLKVLQSLILCALRGFLEKGRTNSRCLKNGGIWRKKWGKSFFIYYFCFEILLKSATKPYFMRSSGFLKSRAANRRVLILALEMAWKSRKEKRKNMKACVGASERFFVFSLSLQIFFEGNRVCPKEGRWKCERTFNVYCDPFVPKNPLKRAKLISLEGCWKKGWKRQNRK